MSHAITSLLWNASQQLDPPSKVLAQKNLGLGTQYRDTVKYAANDAAGTAGWWIGQTVCKKGSGSRSVTAWITISRRTGPDNTATSPSDAFSGYLYIGQREQPNGEPKYRAIFNSYLGSTLYWELWAETTEAIIDGVTQWTTNWYIIASQGFWSSVEFISAVDIRMIVLDTVGDWRIPSQWTDPEETASEESLTRRAIRIRDSFSTWHTAHAAASKVCSASRCPFFMGNSGVGNSNTPVYVETDGEIKACTISGGQSDTAKSLYEQKTVTGPRYMTITGGVGTTLGQDCAYITLYNTVSSDITSLSGSSYVSLTTQGLLIRDTTAGHKVSIKLYGSSDDNVMTIRQIKLDSGGYNYGVICTISQKYSGNYSISRISPGIINCAQDASPITDMTLADKQLNMGANGITIKDGNNTRTFNAANGASYAQDSLKWGGYQIAVSGTPTAGSGTIYFV